MIEQYSSDRKRAFDLPLHGASNPSSQNVGPTPGSFANRPEIGGPRTYSSPDTPGRLVAGGAKERSSVTMGFSPESGTLEETYYQQLRQGSNQPRSRGLASSEERRPRVSSGA